MTSVLLFACFAILAASVPVDVASAAARTDTYRVEHPLYGDIGTYVYAAEDVGGVTRISSRLRVAVSLIGFVIYRQDADQIEIFRGTRLISFQSAVDINGHRINVHGEARGDKFFVTSASGTRSAPASIAPSDPWSLKRLGSGVVVSTKTGEIDNVDVTGGEADTIVLHGISTPARHFHIRTETQRDKWEVWLDGQGVPIKFRSLEEQTPIDFILTSATPATADNFGPVSAPQRWRREKRR